MKEIGGYFELEIKKDHFSYHDDFLYAFKNGRTCLKYILQTVEVKKIYIPYFSCQVILEPITELNISYEFYKINNQLECQKEILIKENEYILYVNYFGLKSNYCNKLEKKYAHQLIIDNTHAFFYKPSKNRKAWYFNSCRKYFGVPDGAYLHTPKDLYIEAKKFKTNSNYHVNHLIKRLEENADAGYQDFLLNEELFDSSIALMSNFSSLLLSNVDYQLIAERRQTNFLFLHQQLGGHNQLRTICDELEEQIPFCYPYLPKDKIEKKILWEQKIFVPIFWKECLTAQPGFTLEKALTELTIHIPVDHRYDEDDLIQVVDKILEIEKRK